MNESDVANYEDQRVSTLAELTYSLNYEKMTYKLFARFDKWATFITLLFAMHVIANTTNETFSGVSVALLAVFQLVFTPAAKSYNAKIQYQAYLKCYQNAHNLTEQEIGEVMASLNDKDSDSIGLLSHPARLAGLAMLGIDNRVENVNERKMKPLEKLAVWFVGETPEYQFSEESK